MNCGTDNSPTDGLSSERSRQAILSQFHDEWLEPLDRDDLKSLFAFLCHQILSVFQFTDTNLKADHYAVKMVHRSDQTVHRWCLNHVSNDNVFHEIQQCSYKCRTCFGNLKSTTKKQPSLFMLMFYTMFISRTVLAFRSRTFPGTVLECIYITNSVTVPVCARWS